MKRSLTVAAALAALIPGTLDARVCGVQCQPFVAVQSAVVAAVPIAVAAPVSYSYTPAPQPITVNVNLNTDQIAQAVVDKLNGPAPSNAPPLPAPPPVPQAAPQAVPPPPAPVQSAVSTNCLSCHSPGRNAAAVAKIDLTQPLSCEQRLACARAVLAGRMPKGKTLDANAAGAVLEELVGK